MRLEPMNGTFAQHVTGLDWWQQNGEEAITFLRQAYGEHPVLILRRQILNEAELLQFGRSIGTPRIYAETHWQSEYPEVVLVSNMRNADGKFIGGLSNNELTWHTDQSYYAEPMTGCFLYATVVPRSGGQTTWANLYGAYDALPTKLRTMAEGAVGTFSYRRRTQGGSYKDDNHNRDRLKHTPDVKHRLVHTHPVTGRKALFIDPNTVTTIDGMPDDEASDFLEELLQYAIRPENTYCHEWEVGDLVLWDNAAVLHRREPFPGSENRLLKRMILQLSPQEHIVPGPI